MKRCSFGLLLCLAVIVGIAACQPQVEVVTVESKQPGSSEQVVVTRLVMVTPEGAGPATPGTMTPPLAMGVATTNVVTVTVAAPTPMPVGLPERPVRLLFPADVSEAVLTARAGSLVDALADETGVSVTAEQLESYKAVVDALCAAPAETIGILPPMGYVLANQRCEVQAGATAQRFGLSRQMGMIVARADSGIQSLADLSEKRWAKAAPFTLTRDLYFQALFDEAGVEPAEVIEYAGDSSALLAVLEGEADFATATYLPPILPYMEREWIYGEDEPEGWRRLGIAPERHPVGYVVVIADPEDGGYQIRDARAALFDVQPDVFSLTRIIDVTEPIPNDTVVFGSEFPLALAGSMRDALLDFAASDVCGASICANDFYGWGGLSLVTDLDYEPLRFIQRLIELPEERLWETLGQ